MAPGLTSTMGLLPDGGEKGLDGGLDIEKTRALKKGEPVVVRAEGKEEACAVGLLSMDTEEVKKVGKGPVVEEAHYLGDGLWKLVTE